MRIPNIYTSGVLATKTEIQLEESEAHHIVKVLRMKRGFKLRLFNGDGFFYDAEISQIDRRSASVCISSRTECLSESNLDSHIGLVMSRGDRMDYAIQKATELGVKQITPLYSERCEVRLSEDKQDKQIQRWQQVAISACEQCGRATVPVVKQIEPFSAFVSNTCDSDALKLVLHHRDTQGLASITPHPQSVIMLIGPEGGLTPEEITLAQKNNYQACTLGPRVLRTETAPVVALSVMQWLWGDFSK